jgi:hypothetical protein
MKSATVLLTLLFTGIVFCNAAEISNTIALPLNNSTGDEFIKSYIVLTKIGNYDEKKKALKTFSDNYKNTRVIDMMVYLLDYFYDKQNFTENDQTMYYDDVIAGEIVKLLGKSGSAKGFPVFLKIVLNSRNHRDDTVREAWDSMEKIRW